MDSYTFRVTPVNRAGTTAWLPYFFSGTCTLLKGAPSPPLPASGTVTPFFRLAVAGDQLVNIGSPSQIDGAVRPSPYRARQWITGRCIPPTTSGAQVNRKGKVAHHYLFRIPHRFRRRSLRGQPG